MRRFAMLAATVMVVVVLIALVATPALACDISLTSASATGYLGEQQTVVVQVKLTHRNCITPIDDTQIEATGATILSQTPWTTVASDTFQKTLTIRLDQEGQAAIDVVRECSKGGDAASTTINVLPAAKPGTTQTTSPPPAVSGSDQSSAMTTPSVTAGSLAVSTTTPADQSPVNPTGETLSDQSQPSSKSSGKPVTLASVITEPRILALLGLTVLAACGYITGNHRLRAVTLLASLGYLGFVTGGCLCPLGAFQKLFVGLDSFWPRLVGYVILAIPVVSTLFFGRLYCGWICPSGALQELPYRRSMAIKVPPSVDRWLRPVKYILLIAMIAAILLTGEPVFEGMDPFKVAFNLSGDTISIIALAVIILASLFFYRPWCRYFCPMGALLGLISRVSVLRWVTNSTCVSCQVCVKSCPTQALEVGSTPARKMVIDEKECVRCGECSSACKKSAVGLAFRPRLTGRLARALATPAVLAIWRSVSLWR